MLSRWRRRSRSRAWRSRTCGRADADASVVPSAAPESPVVAQRGTGRPSPTSRSRTIRCRSTPPPDLTDRRSTSPLTNRSSATSPEASSPASGPRSIGSCRRPSNIPRRWPAAAALLVVLALRARGSLAASRRTSIPRGQPAQAWTDAAVRSQGTAAVAQVELVSEPDGASAVPQRRAAEPADAVDDLRRPPSQRRAACRKARVRAGSGAVTDADLARKRVLLHLEPVVPSIVVTGKRGVSVRSPARQHCDLRARPRPTASPSAASRRCGCVRRRSFSIVR